MGEALGLSAGTSLTHTYQWSTGINDTLPTIIISNPGSFSVTTTNHRGCIAQSQINITLKGMSPTAYFSLGSAKVCLGDTVWATDLSTSSPSDPISTWLWKSGDNTSYSSPGPIGHKYTIPGIFYSKLTVTTDSGCFNTYTDTITVLPKPPVAISPLQACSGTPVKFHHSATGDPKPIAWFWTFHSQGPNPYTDTSSSPVFTWALPGIFPVDLVVTDTNGCSNSGTYNITVNQSPTASITTPQNPVCDGTEVQFTENGTAHPSFPNQYWFWFFDDGTPATPAFTNSIAHEFSHPGQFTVSVIAGSIQTGCKDSAAIVFDVKHLPEAKIITTDLCEGQIQQLIEASTIVDDTLSQWIWYIQGNGVLTGKQPAFVFNDTGSFQVSLSVTTVSGCSDTTTSVFTVHETPEARFSLTPIYGNPPLEVSFTNLSTKAQQYTWDFGDGNTSVKEDPKHTYTQSGIFDIILTAHGNKGCHTTYGSKVYTIQPEMDLQIIHIEGTIDGEWVMPVLEIRNNSNLEVHKVMIEAWLGGGSPIREIWSPKDSTDKLMPGSTKLLPLNAHLFAPNWDPDLRQIVCAKAIIPEFPEDTYPDNNTLCAPIYRTFIVRDPWPNPTISHTNIDVIIDYPDDLTVEVFNLHGQSLGQIFNDYLKEGLTRITIPLNNNLKSGVYIMVFRYRDHVLMKRLIIQ
jgi:PKD repeat protein